MKFGTSVSKLAFVAGVLGVCSFGMQIPSAFAQPNTQAKVDNRVVKQDAAALKRAQINAEKDRRRAAAMKQSQTVVTTTRTRTVVVRHPVVQTNPNIYRGHHIVRDGNYNGRVTYVSGSRLGLDVGDHVFTVTTSSNLPRNVKRGDYVRVIGVRINGNTIRGSRVSITRSY